MTTTVVFRDVIESFGELAASLQTQNVIRGFGAMLKRHNGHSARSPAYMCVVPMQLFGVKQVCIVDKFVEVTSAAQVC